MNAVGLSLASLGLVAVLPAQELTWVRQGVENQTQLGDRVATFGDLDGDGYTDLMHIGWRFTSGPIAGRSKDTEILFLSGRDGSTIRTVPAMALGVAYDEFSAAGDMDGDQVPDYIVSYAYFPTPKTIEVRSGADDRVLWSLQGALSLGAAILGDVDLDGDGRPDFLLTEENATPYGVVHAYRNDGTWMHTLLGTPELQFPFGSNSCLGRIGDFDGDGHEDFVLGAIDTLTVRGAAVVVSGATFEILAKGLGPDSFEAVGHAVDGAGDMDRDGVLDFVASSSGSSGLGVALAFSGATGQALQTWWGPTGVAQFGISLKSSGQDLNQDGVPDVVVGDSFNGSVFFFSGRDGTLIHRLNARKLGIWLDVIPAQPQHPFPLVALPQSNYASYSGQWGPPEQMGRIRLFRGNPDGVDYLGPGCRGQLGQPPRIGFTDRGSSVRVHLSNDSNSRWDVPPARATPATLLLGVNRGNLNRPIAHPQDLSGCQVYPMVRWTPTVTTGTNGLDSGYAALDIPMPLANGNPTVRLYAQWMVGGTGAMSGGLSWTH